MTLQKWAKRARVAGLVLVAGGAVVGALSFGLIVRTYTRPLTPKGTPS